MTLGLVPLLTVGLVALPPIESVAVGPQRALTVNGQPFFPLLLWLVDPSRFPNANEIGVNTITGYWPRSGDTADVAEYLPLVRQAGLYGVMPFDQRLAADPALLGWIQGDEPDLSHDVSDAEVIPDPALRLNNSTPLWKLLDGGTTSWSVLDPLAGAKVTVKLREPVTIVRFGLHLTISPGLAVAEEVRLLSGETELARATLEAKKGRQEIPLAAPATVSEVTLEVVSARPGEQVWGSIGELEGFDSAGRNVLLSPPRKVPRAEPAESIEVYRSIRAADPTHPVFLTVTGNFLPHFKTWSDERRAELYPGYAAACDVVGFDIYPLYGWGRPDWIHLVHDGAAALRELAGERPLYAWIETCKGSQWVSAERQPEITPAHIRCEVWQAICGGATAIGYFTHAWKPSYSQFAVPAENVVALRAINDQITRLAPAILAPETTRAVTIQLAGDLRSAVKATEHDGALHLFAVNLDPSAAAGEATIAVAGLPAGAMVEVLDEGRTITAEAGSFRDRFEGYAVHLYRATALP